MKFTSYTFHFKGGSITVQALNETEAKILAQAEAIKRGWDYKIIDYDERLPSTYAEIEYSSERLESDPEAIEGARWDDMNYRHYMER